MKHTEYIVPIGEDAQDYDEMFIGVIRRQPELIRCKDCKHAEREEDGDIMCTFWDFCECNHHVLANGYCDRAERRKDDRRQNNTV